MKWLLYSLIGFGLGATSASVWHSRKVALPVDPGPVAAIVVESAPVVEPVAVVLAEPEEGFLLVDRDAAIRALEEKLAAKDGELSMLRASMAATAVIPEVMQTTEPEDRRTWLENMQSNDPQRYQEIMVRREAARQAARYEMAKKAAHFLFREEGDMSEDENLQHMQMMSLLHESLKLTEQLNAELPGDQRRDIMRELRRNMRDLSPLLQTERDREFFRIGKDLGYNDTDAAGFALYIRDVIDLTSVQSIFRSSMRAMGGGGGWGGGDRPDRPGP